MANGEPSHDPLTLLVAEAERLLPPAPNPIDHDTAERVNELLRDVERQTPHGAPLHAQLDTVIKWVRLLAEPDSHARYGGAARLHEHIQLQFRLAKAAAADYVKATG